MKKRIVFVCIALFAMATNASSADYYMPAESTNPRFRIESNLLTIWGGDLQTVTGYSVLQVTDQEVPYDTIRSWYATVLTCKVMGWDVRVTYDNNATPPTGKIIRIIPQFEP